MAFSNSAPYSYSEFNIILFKPIHMSIYAIIMLTYTQSGDEMEQGLCLAMVQEGIDILKEAPIASFKPDKKSPWADTISKIAT